MANIEQLDRWIADADAAHAKLRISKPLSGQKSYQNNPFLASLRSTLHPATPTKNGDTSVGNTAEQTKSEKN